MSQSVKEAKKTYKQLSSSEQNKYRAQLISVLYNSNTPDWGGLRIRSINN